MSIFLHIYSCGGDTQSNKLPLKFKLHPENGYSVHYDTSILAIFHLSITVIVHISVKNYCV